MSKSSFIDTLLQMPSYGWKDANGNLTVPSTSQLWKEAFSRINIFRTKKNWLSFFSCVMVGCMLPLVFLFLFKYFSWYLVIAIVIYSMPVMGTHGTIWFHRYCTHKSYVFSHPIWRIVTQNLVIKTVCEEIYVVSHHVHHSKSDEPGDPYNAQAGFLYCMLAEFNHQRVSPHLNEEGYKRVTHFMKHTGVKLNSFKQYRKWGSIAAPGYTIGLCLLNWGFWYAVFFLVGGHALACAMFTAAMFWFVLIRAFNYTGHGKGEVKHKDGVDFDRSNLSINQTRPGLLAGEWHNNHHLYPGSARAGFLPSQLDLAWIYIYVLYRFKMISSYRDSKKEFLKKYIIKGHSRDMVPLAGEAYNRQHLSGLRD
jgi:stearoyl-CoA desaturase (delta-9 desaturase)